MRVAGKWDPFWWNWKNLERMMKCQKNVLLFYYLIFIYCFLQQRFASGFLGWSEKSLIIIRENFKFRKIIEKKTARIDFGERLGKGHTHNRIRESSRAFQFQDNWKKNKSRINIENRTFTFCHAMKMRSFVE